MVVKSPNEDFAASPDATVVCGEPKLATHEKNPALTKPTVVVELLSATTDASDRGEKFERYKTLPSLRDYVLVSQETNLIEVFSRDRGWARVAAGAGAKATLPSIGVTPDADEIYFNRLA